MRALIAGGLLVGLFVTAALVSFVWTPHDATAIQIAGRLQAPSITHPFGTDHFGRDVFSMIMVGARLSIAVAVLAVGIGMGFGVPLGLAAAARRGGWLDEIIMRGNDLVFAFPALLIAIMITAVFGPGAVNAIIAIGIFNVPVFARLTRGAALSLWTRDFVLAARVAGKGRARISVEHILPNVSSLLIVQGTIQFSLGVLAEAALSYVGLGAQPPTPSWGRMLAEAQTMVALAPWLAIFPGLAIALTVLGLNLMGDGLRDWLDPRTRGGGPVVRGPREVGAGAPPTEGAVRAVGRPAPLAATQGAADLLAIEDLDASIGGVPILRGVSMSVGRGEVLGVIGESGSGKSMTALAVMGLLPGGARAEGRIALDGEDLLGMPERALCRIRGERIGMIFQEPMTALNPLKTIGDQVAETVMVHGRGGRREALAIARETLDRVGLRAGSFPLSRYPHELSGGQRQRVGIAMAVALRPKLLIADEPTTALDVTTQAGILALLRRLVAEDGMGLILVSHDLAVVADMADRLAIMRGGEVVETGRTREVFRHSRHPYTRALLAASSHRPARLPRVTRLPLLRVEAVSRDYGASGPRWWSRRGTFRAVSEVGFTLHRGESLGLVGESGSGKSTLARAVLGLEALQEGRIVLDGEAVTAGRAMPASLRAKMQVVFQDPYGSFNPRHRVARLVTEPFHLVPQAPRGQARRRAVAEALEAVGLRESDARKYIHEFSGGQRQRIALARALIIRPKLIVLDEAVSALDVQVRAQILDLLADLSSQLGLSYLFISHDIAVVRAITDRVLVMKDGVIVEQGPTEAVFDRPEHPYTRALLAAVPVLERSA